MASLLRLLTAVVAADLPFDGDEIDDLKLAVQELFAVSIGSLHDGELLDLTFVAHPRQFSVEGRAQHHLQAADLGLDPVAKAVLAVAVDRFDLLPAPDVVFRLEKSPAVFGLAR